MIVIASASPLASAMLALAIPSACASCCLASTSILKRSFSALNAFCSASTLDSIADANNVENWKSVIETTSVTILKSINLSLIADSMSDLTWGLLVINSSAL